MRFSRLEALARDFRQHVSEDAGGAAKPVVILLHGLGGDFSDWTSPFLDRNWPYDHRKVPGEIDLGLHSGPPIGRLPGIDTRLFLSPRLASNVRGHGGSDDRSWWHALIEGGYPVFAYTQTGDLMVPLSRGPVAQFKMFMETLQEDVLGASRLRSRPVVLLGHSRGGLIARAYLGDRDIKADRPPQRFPSVRGLITLSSPHQGSHVALLDDKIIGLLNAAQKIVPTLPKDVGNQVINALKSKVDSYVGPHGDEIEPGSSLFRMLEAQEPLRSGVRLISVGGTSPRFLRLYLWTFTADSALPRRTTSGKVQFRWRARAREARGASPVPDGLPLKLLGIDLEEVLPGHGDGLTANRRCRFPASFGAEEHLSFPVSHAEALWDRAVQGAVIQRLETLQ